MHHSPQYIWQQHQWPAFRYNAGHLLSALIEARRTQGILLGKVQTLGLAALPAVENEVWVSEAIATFAIEGEKVNLDAVKSPVARRVGMATLLLVQSTEMSRVCWTLWATHPGIGNNR
ncbi:DUF4172 domain-containing protein [Herbaspirillum sp. GCM10030257]|uniref:DUF4172 domain-containing protein n=1 Tax=Herbaspirillum sp. GCM10030257 TaxID=3273393 RepID=UPI00361BF4A2